MKTDRSWPCECGHLPHWHKIKETRRHGEVWSSFVPECTVGFCTCGVFRTMNNLTYVAKYDKIKKRPISGEVQLTLRFEEK